MDRNDYPDNWPELSRYIRFDRAKGQCECLGECGLHKTNPGPRRCQERNGEPAKFAKGTVVLTTAHLCHDPSCADPLHLKAMCNRCHLRYDVKLHIHHAKETRKNRLAVGDLFI